MRDLGVPRLAACVLMVAALASCGTGISSLHVGEVVETSTSLSSPATLGCTHPGTQPQSITTSPARPGETTPTPAFASAGSKATQTITTNAIVAVPTSIVSGTGTRTPTSALCTSSGGPAPSTTAATTTTSLSSAETTVRPGCQFGPSLTLTPSSGRLGTQVTETARCFPPRTMVTFEVPQSAGVAFVAAPTDASGTATVRFTYSTPNGVIGSTTYRLLVSTDPNAGVDYSCTPTTCASATFYER